MRFIKNSTNEKKIKEAIDSLMDAMALESPDSDEYKKMAENLRILQEAKCAKKTWISGDALFGGLISIGGILLILNYEKLDVIATKALPFVAKVKL